MRESRFLVGAAFAVLVLAGQPARAAVSPGEWFISGGYGIYNANSTVDTPRLVQPNGQPYSAQLVGSTMFSGRLCYHFTPHFGLGFEFIQRTEKGGRVFQNGDLAYASSINHRLLLATARYVFVPERSWNPYVVGGVGMDMVSINLDGLMPPPFYPYLTSAKSSANLLAGSAGVGLEGAVASNLFVGAELGILGVPSGTTNRINISSEVMPYLAARLGFDFGGVGR